MADLPHFAFPFTLGAGGHVNVVEQDTAEHVIACENIIVRCPVGYRPERPEFGWQFPEFRSTPLDLSTLTSALRRFEPRGRATATEYADAASAAVRHVQLDIEV